MWPYLGLFEVHIIILNAPPGLLCVVRRIGDLSELFFQSNKIQ